MRYVCDHAAPHMFEDIKEVSTCAYQAVVRTQLLCANPAYAVPDLTAHPIQCFARSVGKLRKLSTQVFFSLILFFTNSGHVPVSGRP